MVAPGFFSKPAEESTHTPDEEPPIQRERGSKARRRGAAHVTRIDERIARNDGHPPTRPRRAGKIGA
jgi:hypothetical protein